MIESTCIDMIDVYMLYKQFLILHELSAMIGDKRNIQSGPYFVEEGLNYFTTKYNIMLLR